MQLVWAADCVDTWIAKFRRSSADLTTGVQSIEVLSPSTAESKNATGRQRIAVGNAILNFSTYTPGYRVLQDLTSSQTALAQYMSELSENAYCAGWMDRLEFDLWIAVASGPFRYGRLELTSTHIQRLSELSHGCGGWIAFEGEREETFIPLDKWLSRVASFNAQGYRPPESRDELERRYAAGERHFPNTELSDADLSGIELDGANFEPHSWFSDANFSHASLRGTSFRECNIKCADFSNSDLTGAIFEFAAIESIKTDGALRDGVKVGGATFYGCELVEGDELPSWEW